MTPEQAEQRMKTKQEIIHNASDAVIRWLERDQSNGGYFMELITINSLEHLIQGGWDETIFEEMDAEHWLNLESPEGWWVWIFDHVYDRLHNQDNQE